MAEVLFGIGLFLVVTLSIASCVILREENRPISVWLAIWLSMLIIWAIAWSEQKIHENRKECTSGSWLYIKAYRWPDQCIKDWKIAQVYDY